MIIHFYFQCTQMTMNNISTNISLCIPFFSTCLLLRFLVWSFFPFPFLPVLEFYSELYLLFFFSTLISSLLLLLLILYLILLLLSSLFHRWCFDGFVLFLLELFVWPIYPCRYLQYCDIASTSYNVLFTLLAIPLSGLLVQYKVLSLVDWVPFLRLYYEFFLDVVFLFLTIISGLPSHTGGLALNMF